MFPEHYRVAAHEAGHAIAALYQGLPLVGVGVGPPNGDGYTTMDCLGHDPQVEMFVAAAGREAEILLCGGPPDGYRAHRTDFERALSAATHYAAGDDPAGMRMLAFCRGEAAALVRTHAPLIQALAGELATRGHMTGEEVAEVAAAHGWTT